MGVVSRAKASNKSAAAGPLVLPFSVLFHGGTEGGEKQEGMEQFFIESWGKKMSN